MVPRLIFNPVKEKLFKGKVIILVGSRQVGKSTFLKQIIDDYSRDDFLFLNCDEPDTLQLLQNVTSTELKALVGNKKLLLIDEAQRVENIGITLKLIVDNISGVQVIATGSSAFDLRNRLNEPLTGRKFEFKLYPFSTGEMVNYTSKIEEKRLLEHRLIYGMYPDVIKYPSDAHRILFELTNSYLFKDILMYGDIRQPDALTKLLIALSLQLGNEVSYNELGNTIGLKSETVERYIDLLEKVFIIFRLPSLSRNLRNELKKSRKVYFYDNGVRNALIQNFRSLNLRTDKGALFENYMISERKKHLEYSETYSNQYFWRTHSQKEIDYIEERNGMLYAFEFKWDDKKKVKKPDLFAEAYPNHKFACVNRTNYLDFITGDMDKNLKTL